MTPDAETFSAHGLTVGRIDGWSFLQPDGSVGQDTVVVLQGPFDDAALAPAVEISRRALDARNQRRKPAHILTEVVTELVQIFDGFEMIGTVDDVQLGGKPGAMVRMRYSESLPDGAQAERLGRFYGVVNGGNIWIIRCMGASDGSNDAEFDRIVASLAITAGEG